MDDTGFEGAKTFGRIEANSHSPDKRRGWKYSMGSGGDDEGTGYIVLLHCSATLFCYIVLLHCSATLFCYIVLLHCSATLFSYLNLSEMVSLLK
jgi:hypothetical protein